MKRITHKTLLKQGDKKYEAVEVDGVIYWINDEQLIEGKEYNDVVFNKGKRGEHHRR